MELLAPEVTYRVLGRHSLSGEFSGRRQVAEHLARLVERTQRTFNAVKWDDWMIGDRHVAAVVTVHAQARGALYVGRQIFVAEFNPEEEIAAMFVFFEDERAAKRFFGP